MGDIRHLDIQQILDRADIENFIETGTGEHGFSVTHALSLNIKNIISIEIEPVLYEHCSRMFASEPSVKLYCGHSPDVLSDILPVEGATLWWLDAHFPGADSTLSDKTLESTTDKEKRCPLEQELTVIRNKGDHEKDYFIIDDLRIYEDADSTQPYGWGNWSEKDQYGVDGIGFIYQLFDPTHDVKKLYADQGYILMVPKA